MGAIGEDTNNSVELEGLIRGSKVLINGGFLPARIEGDSNTLIIVAKRLLNGQTTEKISPSWRLAYRLDLLHVLLLSHPAISFHHVRREANKVVDYLANAGVECGVGFRCDGLDGHDKEDWAQQCSHLATRDLSMTTQLDDWMEGRTDGVS